MTKKKPITDPEWNPQARAGEIMSQLTQLGEKVKALVSEVEAKNELDRRKESVVLKRGVLEIRSVSDSFIASFQNVPSLEVNGITVPPRPGQQVRGVGADPYEAVKSLAIEMKAGGALG